MTNAEYLKEEGCLQRDSAEHEEYAGAQSVGVREGKEADGAELLERILSRENLNRAYKRVKANKGAPGVDGMTVEDALPWLQQHRQELLESIRAGKYKPQPVRRKEIPKPDGGVRQLGTRWGKRNTKPATEASVNLPMPRCAASICCSTRLWKRRCAPV